MSIVVNYLQIKIVSSSQTFYDLWNILKTTKNGNQREMSISSWKRNTESWKIVIFNYTTSIAENHLR